MKPLMRVSSVLALCAACYGLGRWTQRLEAAAENPRVTVVYVERTPSPGERAGLAPGAALDEHQALITPLNVRDPSALVMKPFDPLHPEKRVEPDPNF